LHGQYLFQASYTQDGIKGLLKDNASAAAVSLAVCASGAVHAKTTVLMTPEEMDAATEKTVSYRAPGR
jgi:hypothetical protein